MLSVFDEATWRTFKIYLIVVIVDYKDVALLSQSTKNTVTDITRVCHQHLFGIPFRLPVQFLNEFTS